MNIVQPTYSRQYRPPRAPRSMGTMASTPNSRTSFTTDNPPPPPPPPPPRRDQYPPRPRGEYNLEQRRRVEGRVDGTRRRPLNVTFSIPQPSPAPARAAPPPLRPPRERRSSHEDPLRNQLETQLRSMMEHRSQRANDSFSNLDPPTSENLVDLDFSDLIVSSEFIFDEPQIQVETTTEMPNDEEEEVDTLSGLDIFSLFQPAPQKAQPAEVNQPKDTPSSSSSVDAEVRKLKLEKSELQRTLQWKINILEKRIVQLEGLERLFEDSSPMEQVSKLSLSECSDFKKKTQRLLQSLEAHETKLQQQKLKKDCYEELYFCLICQERERNICFEPCAHFCICRQCGETRGVHTCPICRVPITGHKAIFLS